VGLAAAILAALALATPASFVQERQQPGGGFSEPGGKATPGLTAWAALGLRAAGRPVDGAVRQYLVSTEDEAQSAADVELAVAAESVLGGASPALLRRLHGYERPSGSIGPTLNSTAWGVLALRQAGEPVPTLTARFLLTHQSRTGGWSWTAGGQPDVDDTAAVVEALRAVGVRGKPIRRALAYVRRRQLRDGGFESKPGYGSNVQSTAWAIQAFVAAGKDPGKQAFAYLQRMRRGDGSLRYSARYATTPLWVTAQALPALARKPFPLR
jgi:prenyltransferase/squalene oxidase-like repeat protein